MALVRDENGKLQYVRADGTVAASSRGSWHNKKVTTDQGAKDYNNFLYELDTFQRQMDADFKSRDGKYQSADTLGRTKTRTDERIAGMRKKVGQFASYFNTNSGLYDDESVSMVRAQLADAAKFLDSVRDAAKSEQDYWSQWETEDDYNTYSRRASMDIGNSQKTLEAKRAELKKAEEELAAAQRSSMSMPSLTGGTSDSNGPAAWDRAQEAQKKIEALRREIGLAEVDISEAERIQRSQMYAKRLELPDIDVWAKRGAAIKNPTFEEVEGTWEVTGKDKREGKIGNIVTYSRDNWERLAAEDAETGTYAGSVLYHYMTEDEVKLYNATLAKEGKAAAKEFLDYLMPTLQARYGAEQGKNISGIQNPIAKTAALGFFSLGAGTDQWVSGTKQLFTGETLPTSPTQVASQTIQDSLGKTGKLLYGAGTTIGNMLPSIILGNAVGGIAGATAGKVASAVSMGGASAGNTYNQVMQAAAAEGYTKDQAMTYAALVGASEAGLSYLLGGAGNVAGVGEEKLLAKVAGIDKVLARLALSGAIRIGSEEAEELAQLWIEPVLETLILGTEFEAPTWEEHVETAIITALSTGILEGGSIIGTEINYDKYGKYLLNETNRYQQSGIYGVISEALENLDTKSKAYRMAQDMQEQLSGGANPTYSDVGRLHAMLLYEQGGKNYGKNRTAETKQQTEQAVWNQAAARAFGETGQKAFQTVNDGSVNSADLFAGFAVYHKAGMDGTDIKSVKSEYAKTFPENFRKIAYDAGVQDAVLEKNTDEGIENPAVQTYTDSNNTTEVPNNGEGVHLRDSSQWTGGQNPGGQVSAVEEGTGRDQSWQAEGESADSAADSLSYGQKVSTASLGIRGGSTEANIRIVTGGETVATRAAMKTAKDNGLQLTLFVGGNLQIGNESGKMDSVRAYISGKNVYVRADHPVYTADQLMRHEAGHAKIARGEIDPDTVRERIDREYGQEHMGYLSEIYAEAYEGTGLSADAIWEEVICDSLGDMNIFRDVDGLANTAGVLLNEVKESAEAETQAARGPPAKDTNVPGKMSRENLLGKTFPPYNVSHSDANEQATRWAHREDIQPGDQKLSWYRGSWYLIEAFADADLGYQIVEKLTLRQYNAYVKEKRENGNVSGVQEDLSRLSELDRERERAGGRKRSADPAQTEQRGENLEVRAVGEKQNEGRETAGDRSGDLQSSRTGIEGVSGKASSELESMEELRKQNLELQKQVEYWKGQTKRTTRETATLRQEDIDKLARRIVKDYSSTMKAEDIAAPLKQLGEYILRDGDGRNELTWPAVKEQAVDIARGVVQSAKALRDDVWREYSDLRQYLRTTDIVFGKEYQSEIADYSSFRKRNNGRLKLAKGDGTNVDQVYKELAEQWPGFFNEEAISNPADQLLHIEEVLESLKPIYENPYSYHMAEATEYLANEIVDSLLSESVRQSPKTFADKQALKLDRLEANHQRTIASMQRAIDSRNKKLEDVKKHYAEVAERKKARAADSAARTKLLQIARRLQNETLPSADRAKIEAYIGDLDTVAVSITGDTIADLYKLWRYYENLKKDPNFTPVPSIENKLKRLSQRQIEDLTLDEVRSLTEALLEIEKQITYDDKKARDKLFRIAKRLQNKKLPAASRALLNQYIGDLDTVAKSLTGNSVADLNALWSSYEKMKEDPDFIADPYVEKRLRRLSQRQVEDLTADEVLDLTKVLSNIENQLRYMDKLTDSLEKRNIYNMGLQIIADVENTNGSKTGILGIPSKYIVTEVLSPIRMIRRMTGYVDNDPLYTVANELADGQRKQMDFQRRAGEMFKKWVNDKKFSQSIAGEKAQWIEIAGVDANGKTKKVKITPAMRMSLYLHSLNSQNMRHVANGGVKIPDVKLYKQGKIADAYDKGIIVRLSPSMVRGITQGMTQQERAFAQAASRYFNGMSQTEINEVSEKLKGYSLAQVENYFPIDTDSSFTRKDFEALKFDGTIEGMGFLKERVKSSVPIMLRDMNSVLTQSIDMTSKYVGLAIPVRNFNKVWGVTKASFKENGERNTNYESSVQDAVKRKWGEDGYKYVENMMTDLNTGRPAKDVWAKALNKIKGNYAGAVLTLNPGVALKQYGAWFSAGSTLGFKSLAKALGPGKVDVNLIHKYTPLLWYRSQGFSTQELGDMAKNDKRLPKWLDWLSGTDVQITTRLWKAAEHYVRANNKDLKFGTDAFYKAVAEVYNRTIEETQPNYTTMQRPQLLRSENTLMQNLSMFKTDAFQSFNVLYDAMGNLHAKRNAAINTGTPEAKEAYRQAKINAGRAVSAQFMQLALVAGVQVVWNLIRGKREKYEDEEGEITLGSVLGEMGKDMLGGAVSFVPFGSDVWELVSSKLFDETYYGMDAVTVQALTDAVKSISGLTELFSGVAKSLAKSEKVDWREAALAADNYFDDFSKALGIPYENVVNTFNAAYLNGAKWMKGKYLGTYAAMQLNTGYKSGTGDYYDLLWKALKAGDMDAYQTISEDLQKNIEQYEMTGESITSAMRSRYNKAVKENPNFKLPQRAADLIGVRGKYAEDEEDDSFGADDLGAEAYQQYINEQADTYRSVFDKIQSYASFAGMDAEAKDKVVAAADKFAKRTALENASDGEYVVDTKWIDWARNGDAAGVDEAEAILFKIAYDMAVSDHDKNGKVISGSKKENTLELAAEWLPGLTDKELEYLKSNYWK